MRFLQIGLGSMGKRRIRCLKRLGLGDITGFDMRGDRRKEAGDLYGISTTDKVSPELFKKFDAVIISTSPAHHLEYMKMSLASRRPTFIEASILPDGLAAIDRAAKKKKVFMAPSCTMMFHPAVKLIKAAVLGGKYGKLTDFSYHSGSYLPDWHPWEPLKGFFASQKKTGACKEIIPVELTWLCDIAGLPTRVVSLYGRTTDLGAPIDDTYVIGLKFRQGFGALIVDAVSRNLVRRLILNMERAQVIWHWENNWLDIYEAASKKWRRITFKLGKAEKGYNKSLAESMYLDEIRAFLKGIGSPGSYPNTLARDIGILGVLEKADEKYVPGRRKAGR